MTFLAVALLLSCQEETLDDQSFGTLEGKVVTNGLNTPLENVKITTNPASNTVFTDIEGNFSIEDIVVGDYSVQADIDEFQTGFEPASILPGRITNVVFELDSTEASNLPPLVPNLIFPADKQKNVPSPVNFVWSSSANDSDEITYTLELRNGNTGEIQTFESILDTVLTVENLTVGDNYFWQVVADDKITNSVQSKISSFQLQGVEDNRYLFVRNLNGNNVIFSGGEPLGDDPDEINQNEIQLTSSGINAYRPKVNRSAGKIAFIRTIGGEAHIFTMNLDGSDQRQLTQEIPISGFRQDEIEFTWYNSGSAIYYPSFNKIYSINIDGSGTRLVYESGEEEFITEIAANPNSDIVVVKLNNSQGYEAKIRLVNPITGIGTTDIVSGVAGALGGLDFSIDGNRVLYTRDISGVQNTQYRQLDTRIFEYDLDTGTSTEIETGKPTGFNVSDAKYSPNEGFVVFTYASNDGDSEPSVRRRQLDIAEVIENEVVFTNAFMVNWE